MCGNMFVFLAWEFVRGTYGVVSAEYWDKVKAKFAALPAEKLAELQDTPCHLSIRFGIAFTLVLPSC